MIGAILRTEKVRERLNNAGAQVVAGTPAELKRLMVDDTARYGALVRRLNITLD